MKTTRVKLLCLALCMVFAISTLAGCQSTQLQAAAPAAKPAAESADAATPVEPAAEEAKKSADDFHIGVAMVDFSLTFFSPMVAGIQEVCDQYGIDVEIQDGQSDVNTQVGQIETFIAQKKDLIIIVAAQTDALVPIARECNSAGIPIITINRLLGDGAEIMTYVGCDDLSAGKVQGELVKDLVGETGSVVIIQGTLGTSPQTLREQGIEEYLAENAPGIKIVEKQTGDFDQNEAITVMQNYLSSYAAGDIDAVVAQDAYMGLGAVQAIKGAGRDELLNKVIAFDLPQEVKDSINAGDMYGTVLQDSKEQGKIGAEVACKYLLGELTADEIEPQTWTILPKINATNVNDYPAAW